MSDPKKIQEALAAIEGLTFAACAAFISAPASAISRLPP